VDEPGCLLTTGANAAGVKGEWGIPFSGFDHTLTGQVLGQRHSKGKGSRTLGSKQEQGVAQPVLPDHVQQALLNRCLTNDVSKHKL
jgi:hypothetical protein